MPEGFSRFAHELRLKRRRQHPRRAIEPRRDSGHRRLEDGDDRPQRSGRGLGKNVVYRLIITNTGSAPANRIAVKAVVPELLKGKRAKGPNARDDCGRIDHVDKVDSLQPGAKITFFFECEALKPGDVRFRVEYVSDLNQTPIFEEESTHIIAPFTPGGAIPNPNPPVITPEIKGPRRHRPHRPTAAPRSLCRRDRVNANPASFLSPQLCYSDSTGLCQDRHAAAICFPAEYRYTQMKFAGYFEYVHDHFRFPDRTYFLDAQAVVGNRLDLVLQVVARTVQRLTPALAVRPSGRTVTANLPKRRCSASKW